MPTRKGAVPGPRAHLIDQSADLPKSLARGCRVRLAVVNERCRVLKSEIGLQEIPLANSWHIDDLHGYDGGQGVFDASYPCFSDKLPPGWLGRRLGVGDEQSYVGRSSKPSRFISTYSPHVSAIACPRTSAARSKTIYLREPRLKPIYFFHQNVSVRRSIFQQREEILYESTKGVFRVHF